MSISQIIDKLGSINKMFESFHHILEDYDSTADTKKHIADVALNINKVISELSKRAQDHDKSKLSEEELRFFNEYTPRLKKHKYDSPEYREMLKGLKPALDHHYKNNSHHPEHFSNGISGMNLIDILEMLADWKSSTKRGVDGDILKSIEINQDRFKYSDELKQILINTIKYLGWE